MSQPPSLVWLRRDLRLADHPALVAACEAGGPVIPVFIETNAEEAPWQMGAASQWWLHHSLERLAADLRSIGSRLILRRGGALEQLRKLAAETKAAAVFWNRTYDPQLISRDAKIKEALRADGLRVESYNGALLHEPWTIENQSGRPFQVFTPYWRQCLRQAAPAAPLLPPRHLAAPIAWPQSDELASWGLLPKLRWDEGFYRAWNCGEAAARHRLEAFIRQDFADYGKERNRPDRAGTSRLSPHLHFGEVSPRQIWHALANSGDPHWQSSQFLTEVGWREFAHHLLYHFPHTPEAPLRPEWERFRFSHNPAHLAAWCRGRTGYPIVDAGMRELWATGWMHNRVRMIVASFLVKDLHIHWLEGAKWFWDTLVDADLAANTLGWQWTAGCGADAAPFFRIFNPVGQGEKFDPDGSYVRRWLPELARLPAQHIHKPWQAPTEVLRDAAVVLGETYPRPIVDHSEARAEALRRYAELKSDG